MNIFQVNDLIRCVIKSIDRLKETCDVFFELPQEKSIKLVSYFLF